MVYGGGLVETVTLVLDRVKSAFDDMFEGRAHRPEVKIVPALLGERLECDTKTVDNALQRVKRKVGAHLQARAVAA